MSSNHWDVVIIGAGAAGLACARSLAHTGLKTLVLEARDRIGGRIHTLHSSHLALPIELGAEFVHGNPEHTWRLIRQAGLPAYDVPDHHFYFTRNHELVNLPHFWQDLQLALKNLETSTAQTPQADQPFSNYLQAIRKNPQLRRFVPLALSYVEGFHGADPRFLSGRALAKTEMEMASPASRRSYRLAGGYDQILSTLRLGAFQRNECELRLNTVVHQIRWQPGSVELELDSRAGHKLPKVHAQKVVLTLPISLLQAQPGSEGSIRFSPDIDEKKKSIDLLKVGPVSKIILQFRDRFWETTRSRHHILGFDLSRFSFIHSAQDIAFPTWWSALPFRLPILTGWTGGPGALAVSGHSQEMLVSEAINSLSRVLGIEHSLIEERLVGWHCHDWQLDPYARGAYSYPGVGGENASRELGAPIQDTLYFGGEATSRDGMSGTVEGALESGSRVANEILESLDVRKVA